jgi:hypothetical protein
MKERVKKWLASQRLPGAVLACGVRFPDKTSLNRAVSPAFPEAALDNAWRSVADLFQVLLMQRVRAHRVRWDYTQAQVHSGRRSDGIVFALFCQVGMSPEETAEVQRLLDSFERLTP